MALGRRGECVRKGAGTRPAAHAPWVGYFGRTALHPGVLPCQGVRGGYALHLRYATLDVAGALCGATWENRYRGATEMEGELDVGLSHVFDLPVVSVAAGGFVGAAHLSQRFETRGIAPDRWGSSAVLGVLWRASVELPFGFFLVAGVEGRSYLFQRQRSGSVLLDTPLVLAWTAGVGAQL